MSSDADSSLLHSLVQKHRNVWISSRKFGSPYDPDSYTREITKLRWVSPPRTLVYLTSAEYQTSTVALATNFFTHTNSTKHGRVSNQTSEPKPDISPQQVVAMYHGQQLSYWRTALQISLKAFSTQTFAEPRQGRLCLEDLSSAFLIFAIHCMRKRPSQSRMNCSLLGMF